MKITSLRPSYAGRNATLIGAAGNTYTGTIAYSADAKPTVGKNALGKPCNLTKYRLEGVKDIPTCPVKSTDQGITLNR